MHANPYDKLSHRFVPIEWTTPQRLSLASPLHAGPRIRPNRCRVLELGCARAAMQG